MIGFRLFRSQMPSLLLYPLFPRVKQKELTSFTIISFDNKMFIHVFVVACSVWALTECLHCVMFLIRQMSNCFFIQSCSEELSRKSGAHIHILYSIAH